MRKTIKKLVILWAFLPVFMIMNTVFAASGTPLGGSNGQAVLTIDAYNCSSYVTDESSASKITSGLNRCVSAARNGTIPTLKLNDGDTIDAGKYIVVVTKFDSDTPDLVRILNLLKNAIKISVLFSSFATKIFWLKAKVLNKLDPEFVIEKINNSKIVTEQKANPDKNLLTGLSRSS